MNLLASSFGDGDVLLWMVEFFLLVIWFWLLLSVFSDLFRDHEMGGGAKALWIIFVILIPYLGVLIYFIVRGKGMAERNIKAAQQAQEQVDARIRAAAGTSGGTSAAEQIEKAKGLLDSGAISQAEFDSLKSKALGS